MTIQPLTANDSSEEILFDSFIIKDLHSFDELLDIYETYKKNYPDKTIIVTLDDLGQAAYTSGHSIHYFDLDDTEGYDLSGLDKACFEDGAHIGYLTTPGEFFIRKENLLKQAKDLDFNTVCDKQLTITKEELAVLEKINQSPFAYIDEQLRLYVVPVNKPYEGICGFPNGYFSCDLNPMENYALARHLFEKYNFALFGIGAALLGFFRKEKLEEDKAKELIADLAKLYNTNETIFDNFLVSITNNNYLFLKYIEYLDA